MTQSQVKQPVTLVSVERGRSGRAPAGSRIADDTLETAVVSTDKSAEDGNSDHISDDLDGFVFEEASPVVSIPTGRETAARSGKPAPDLANGARLRAADPVAETTPVALVTTPSHPAPTTERAQEPGATAGAVKADEPSPTDKSPSVRPTDPARRDLELRTQLQRKDEELLALRTEINARDRQLLEYNTRALEIERARTDIADRMGEQAILLQAAGDQVRALEADKEATAKRMAELKVLSKRSEDSLKRKSENALIVLKTAHGTQVAELQSAHAAKLEQLTSAHAAELSRLNAERTASEEEMNAKHSATIKAAETAATLALSNAIASYSRKIRTLQEAQELALARTTAAHATALEAALAVVASDKASALADAESALRTTHNELSELQTTVQFLERGNAAQADRIAQLQSTVASLEERSRRADEKLEVDAEMFDSVRRALGAGLSILNATRSETDVK